MTDSGVLLVVAGNRFIAILEEMACVLMPEVEGDCVTGQHSPHKYCQGDRERAGKEMTMIVEKRPGKALGFSCDS